VDLEVDLEMVAAPAGKVQEELGRLHMGTVMEHTDLVRCLEEHKDSLVVVVYSWLEGAVRPETVGLEAGYIVVTMELGHICLMEAGLMVERCRGIDHVELWEALMDEQIAGQESYPEERTDLLQMKVLVAVGMHEEALLLMGTLPGSELVLWAEEEEEWVWLLSHRGWMEGASIDFADWGKVM